MKLHYGEETKKSLNNFPFSIHPTRTEFIFAMFAIKKAAALANYKAGNLSKDISNAIVEVCDEVLKDGPGGKHLEHFPLPSLQGGAGTATHMNVNEFIASKATMLLQKRKMKVHPNNHVNASQSTNDVNPSALRISTFFLLENLEKELSSLVVSLRSKAREWKSINKLARTHLQDAIPTTLGAEFSSYADNLDGHKVRLKLAQDLCKSLNLGGTAIGDSTNASPLYIKECYKELNKILGKNFSKAKNLMAKTSSQTDFLIISQTITSLCVDLSKIANDLRFMTSGPRGGIGEIILPELQKGSSIMPGKVNPIMPETVNQLYYLVSGNNLSIEKAVESAQLELGAMLPLVVDKLIESLKLTTEVIHQFNELCIKGIKADRKMCLSHLEHSTAYATLLVPKLGYDTVTDIVKKSIAQNKTLRSVVVEGCYLKESEFEKIVRRNQVE